MNKFLIGGAAAVLAVAIVPAIAQSVPPPGVAQGAAPAPLPPGKPGMHMKMMSDRVIARDEVVQHVRRLFARFDTNKDGFITKEEMDAAHPKKMIMHGDTERPGAHGMMGDPGAMFDRMDTNHDGSISRQEFMAAHSQLEGRRTMVFHSRPGEAGKMRLRGMGMGMGGHLFEMADTNHDGRVSLAEAQAAALAHFDRADLNHDGKLTPDERRQVHQLMRGGRKPS